MWRVFGEAGIPKPSTCEVSTAAQSSRQNSLSQLLSSRNAHLVRQILTPWVEASAGRLQVPEGLYSPVGTYLRTYFKYEYE
jgi:hypothetical protein